MKPGKLPWQRDLKSSSPATGGWSGRKPGLEPDCQSVAATEEVGSQPWRVSCREARALRRRAWHPEPAMGSPGRRA